MQPIRIIAGLGVVAMAVALIVGFSSGGFTAEGGEIIDLVWGRVTLVDLYVGIALFAAFVAWRERSAVVTIVWIVLFIVLGNLATAVYVLVAALQADSVEELLARKR